MQKQIPDPARIRRVPEHFSWVDHRLVRDEHFRGCDNEALALYLFLVTVGDADGVSWYGDAALCSELKCDKEKLNRLRLELAQKGLIEWQAPFYQVTDLDTERFCSAMFSRVSANADARSGAGTAIGDVIAGIFQQGGQTR